MDDFNWQRIPEPWGTVANRTLLDAFESNRLKTALFVIGRNIEMPEGRALLQAWNEAGHTIGNHTYQHRSLHAISTSEFTQDILRCDAILKSFPHYNGLFRFPVLKEGETAAKRDDVRRFLAGSGMRNGHVTVDASDWYYDAELKKRLQANPAYDASRLREAYLAHLLDRANYYGSLARQVLGRSPRHTLLLHYNLINVLFLNDVCRMFATNGWRLISAAEAYRDPVFLVSPLTLPAGESLIWSLAKVSGRFESQLRYPGEDGLYESHKLSF